MSAFTVSFLGRMKNSPRPPHPSKPHTMVEVGYFTVLRRNLSLRLSTSQSCQSFFELLSIPLNVTICLQLLSSPLPLGPVSTFCGETKLFLPLLNRNDGLLTCCDFFICKIILEAALVGVNRGNIMKHLGLLS